MCMVTSARKKSSKTDLLCISSFYSNVSSLGPIDTVNSLFILILLLLVGMNVITYNIVIFLMKPNIHKFGNNCITLFSIVYLFKLKFYLLNDYFVLF